MSINVSAYTDSPLPRKLYVIKLYEKWHETGPLANRMQNQPKHVLTSKQGWDLAQNIYFRDCPRNLVSLSFHPFSYKNPEVLSLQNISDVLSYMIFICGEIWKGKFTEVTPHTPEAIHIETWMLDGAVVTNVLLERGPTLPRVLLYKQAVIRLQMEEWTSL
jgi:hypothetical protein